MIQLKSFGEEIRILNAKPNSRIGVNKLYKLDPFLDSDYLLRVGGRLWKSHSGAHPLVLPKRSNVSEAIIRCAMNMLPMVEEK